MHFAFSLIMVVETLPNIRIKTSTEPWLISLVSSQECIKVDSYELSSQIEVDKQYRKGFAATNCLVMMDEGKRADE